MKNPSEVRTEAVNLILNALQYREEKLKVALLNNAAENLVYEICSLLLAKHSEAYGKHVGCRFMSEKAINIYKSYSQNIEQDVPFKKRVIHEHLYPKDRTIKDLYEIVDPNYESVKTILDERNIGVLVSSEENTSLDTLHLRFECNKLDIWERYRKAKIVVYNVSWGNKTISSSELVNP